MARKLKSAGYWLYENFYPSLSWAGLLVNASVLLFEKYINDHSCEKVDHYYEDVAKLLFWATLSTRLIVFPLLGRGLDKIARNYLPSKETRSRLEAEWHDGIETGLFVFETIKDYKAPFYLGIVIALPSLWPIFCSCYKFYDPDFVRGPKEYISTYQSRAKRWGIITIEALYNLLSLASATKLLSALLFNLIYNSTHPDPYPNEKKVLLPFITIAAVLGATSIFGNRIYQAIRYSEGFINVFYYFFNVAISNLDCAMPSYFTDQGFLDSGWKYVFLFGVLSLVVAAIGGVHATENHYLDQHARQDDSQCFGQCCGLFSRQGSKFPEPRPIIGLRIENPPARATFY